MTRRLYVTMPDNSIWTVDAKHIIRNYKDYLLRNYPEFYGDEIAAERWAEKIIKNDPELIDWSNTMNWLDVALWAKLVDKKEMNADDFQNGWKGGEKVVYNVQPD